MLADHGLYAMLVGKGLNTLGDELSGLTCDIELPCALSVFSTSTPN
jgi:hypothetical protein